MTLFTAATAAALEISESSLATGVYAYHTVIRFAVAVNASNAPTLVSMLFAQMQLDEPDIVFTDGAAKRIDNDDLPTDKLTFDNSFGVTTNRNSLHCHVIINSSRTFHQIKVGVWDLLQKYNLYLDKSPGPITRKDLVAMGFWLHVHPGFASTRSFHSQLTNNIAARYEDSPVVRELNLPAEFYEPDVYFTATKCKGVYDAQPIQSNVLCQYGSPEDFDRSTSLITRICSFAETDDNETPMYIPFALKKSHPEIYGQYLAQQNSFLETHRNIAIVGMHPSAMDYGDEDSPDPNFPTSLWHTLSNMAGVYRVDSCRRTHDLGKWNISCHVDRHRSITQWIDDNLSAIWAQVPLELPTYAAFSSPERLSRNRVARSVASGLTDASPVSHYLKSLAARHQSSTKPTAVVRNPWRQTPPVQSVVYKFDQAEYPLPNGNAHATATANTAASTLLAESLAADGASDVSRFTASVQLAVDRQLASVDSTRERADADFTARMNAIEDQIHGIQGQIDAMASTVTTSVLAGLQKPDGLLYKQDFKINLLSEQLQRLLPMVEQVLGLNATRPLSPTNDAVSPGKKPKLDDSQPMDTSRQAH
jgi:hypothetical protein